MHIKNILAAAALALAASAPQAQVTVFNTAFLRPLPETPSSPGGGVVLNGFGRNTSILASLGEGPAALGESLAGIGEAPATQAALLPYFDTWNIGTAGVTPGVYSFAALVVDANPGTFFTALTFNSYDAAGVRNTILFNLNAAGTQAIGSGSFTVLARCPVVSCVWIDVVGERPPGAPWGYNGTGTALPVPEPGQWALLALGLLGLGLRARLHSR